MNKLWLVFNEVKNNLVLTAGEGIDQLEQTQQDVLNLIKKIFGIASPIIFTIIAIFAIVKVALLGIKIARSSDEPEERSRYIKGLVWWAIGLGVCIIGATVIPGVIFGALGVK